MCITAENADHTTEAVKEWNRHAQLVSGSQRESLSEPIAIVDDVAMSQHDALGKSGRARRILHVDYIVTRQGRAARLEFSIRHRLRFVQQRIVTDHSAGMLIADVDHPSEKPQLRRLEHALLRAAQFGNNFVNRLDIVDVA